jgi:hypothetical protein
VTFKAAIWEGVVDGPGLYLGTPEERYFADPCPDPSLNASVAKIAYEKCLSKAKAAHPRLRDPDYPEDADEDDATPSVPWYVDVGSAVHSLALRAGKPVVQVRAKNWRKGDEKELRAALRAERKIPLLTKHYDLAHRMAGRLQPVLINLLGQDFAAEAMACSQSEYGWWMRSLMDASSTDLRSIVDLKCTALDMSPRAAGRTMNRNGNTFQSSFYQRNLDQLDPGSMGRRRFTFAFIEFEYPHEIAMVHPDEALKTVGDGEVAAAMRLWDRAMRTGEWPGYPTESQPVSPENWKMRDFEDREMMESTEE